MLQCKAWRVVHVIHQASGSTYEDINRTTAVGGVSAWRSCCSQFLPTRQARQFQIERIIGQFLTSDEFGIRVGINHQGHLFCLEA
eukprot:scaffold2276_cov160-Amphora_coffeaeformis.AAC.8